MLEGTDVVVVGGGIVGTASTAVAEQGWTRVDSKMGSTIYDVEHTAHGATACGYGGEILHRRKGEWKREVKKGPGGNSKTLTAAAVTDDGERFWVVGSSGTLGEYDVANKTIYDHSNPLGISSEFTALSVYGAVDGERVFVGKSSGEVLVGDRTGDGGFDWTLSDIGSGYTVNVAGFPISRQDGFVATNNGGVYRTWDGGGSWRRVGVPGAETGYTAMLVDDGEPTRVYTGGGAGRVLRLDCDCTRWTPFKVGSKRVYALEADPERERYLGAGAGGRSYEYGDAGWYAVETPTGNTLYGAAPASTDDDVDVLVGESGTTWSGRLRIVEEVSVSIEVSQVLFRTN
jgi:photosystem II stability/assembly factor-like uncharacterized protein